MKRYIIDQGLHFPHVAEYESDLEAMEDNPDAMVSREDGKAMEEGKGKA